MASSDEGTPHSTPIFLLPGAPPPASRRTSSLSTSSRSSSWDSSSSFSFSGEFPVTPLKFKGIPFSWERTPGIPKHQRGSKKSDPSSAASAAHLLPLPPAGNSISAAKKLLQQEEISPKKSNRFQRDPFFAALLECSKDDRDLDQDNIWKGNSKNITRTLSDRFGFINMYTSCKRTCAVSESLVYIPRQSPHYLLNRRTSQ